MDYSQHVVLDLFAGTGVGVAVQALGAKEYGVENMPEAVATREANGMETIYHDVWDAHLAEGLEFDTLWASPPCQTFSMAGRGAGRKALDDVLATIDSGAWRDIGRLKEWALTLGDERTGLVLTPLYYAHRFRPMYIALEQVPTVLPVWEAMAAELERMGYSVWTGNLHSEQYGVPQTRKRAFLMARRDGVQVAPPAPTHSKYHSRNPERLDPGVEKWVSMEEALAGVADLKLVGNQVSRGRARGDYASRATDLPAQTLTSNARSFRLAPRLSGATMVSNYGTGGDPAARGRRSVEQPAPTVTSKIDRNKWEEAA